MKRTQKCHTTLQNKVEAKHSRSPPQNQMNIQIKCKVPSSEMEEDAISNDPATEMLINVRKKSKNRKEHDINNFWNRKR